MELETIIKSSNDFLNLQQEVQSGKLAKSVLLISQDSHYAYEFALMLSALIFNDGKDENNENYLRVKSLSHPDLKIYPQKDKLMVADSDSIVEEGSIKPIFANKKVIVVRGIDNSMEQAQNKLLKTLEEPAKNVFFILTASALNQVLPTIRSRCGKIELSKLSSEVIKNIAGEEELVAVLCDGYAGKAMELANRDDLKLMFESVLSCITQLKNSKSLLAYSKKLSNYKNDFELVVEIFSLIMEDILLVKSGKINKVKLKNWLPALQSAEEEYTISAINEIRKLLDKATEEMKYNCNFSVVIENLLLNILEVKYLCR